MLFHLTLPFSQLPFDYINDSIDLMMPQDFQYSGQTCQTTDFGPETEHTFNCLELSNKLSWVLKTTEIKKVSGKQSVITEI